jgi:3',5'-cyclic AMP phosphodiesterase CpdA
MRIIHFSDLHFWNYGLDRDPTFKRALGYANLAFRRAKKFPKQVPERVIQRIVETEADVVIFTGDITTSSLRKEFQRGKEALEPILEKWGSNFFSVPGNHDRYTKKAEKKELYEQYLLDEHTHFPYIKTINGVQFIGLDSTRPCFITSRGTYPKRRRLQLEQLVEKEKVAESPTVFLTHYPVTLPGNKRHRWIHRLREYRQLLASLEKVNPFLYLHGHVHQRWAFYPEAAPNTLCVNSGSAGMISSRREKTAGFVVIETNDELQKVSRVQGVTLTDPTSTEFEEWDIFTGE